MEDIFIKLKKVDIDFLSKEIEEISQKVFGRESAETEKKLAEIRAITSFDNYKNMLDGYEGKCGFGYFQDLHQFVLKSQKLIELAPLLQQMREYLEKMTIPSSLKDLDFQRDVLLSKLTYEAFFEGSINFEVLKMEYEQLKFDYAKFYVMEHNEYFSQLVDLGERIENFETRLEAIEKLSKIQKLVTPPNDIAKKYEAVAGNLKRCKSLTIEVFLDYINPWHSCGFKPTGDNAIEKFLILEDGANALYRKITGRLTKLLAENILADKDKKAVEKIIDALRIADIGVIDRIMSDELMKNIETVITKTSTN